MDKIKSFIERQFWAFGHPKLLWNCFILDMDRTIDVYFCFFCYCVICCCENFCNILKRFYSGFFTSNFPILATNNDGIQHDRQPTHSNYFWSLFFHKDFSKKSGERWTLWVFSLIILSWILFGVIGSDFFLKVRSSPRPVGNFCASLMGSETCSDEFYAKNWLPFHFLL